MEGRKDERVTEGRRERERDRKVENVNYINISLRRERLTNTYSTTDTTKVWHTGKYNIVDDGQRQTGHPNMFLLKLNI